MAFYLVDLMPVLWGLAMCLSILLAAEGERLALLRVLVPSFTGFLVHFLAYPAKVQLLAALASCVAAEVGRTLTEIIKVRKRSVVALQTAVLPGEKLPDGETNIPV